MQTKQAIVEIHIKILIWSLSLHIGILTYTQRYNLCLKSY